MYSSANENILKLTKLGKRKGKETNVQFNVAVAEVCVIFPAVITFMVRDLECYIGFKEKRQHIDNTEVRRKIQTTM